MTAANLAAYDRFLRERQVLTDLETFSRAPLYLKNERLFDVYPRLLIDLAERLYRVDGAPRERLLETVLKGANASGVSKLSLLLDLLRGARSM
jgi:electron transfer flavoprotein-quinone oxidoreductase